MNTTTQLNPNAEMLISKILDRQVPYEVEILDCKFKITQPGIFPPGKLSQMFASYILDNKLAVNKVIADIGAGCFSLGIIAAKNGAKQVVGVDINPEAVNCALENIKINKVDKNCLIYCGNKLDPLMNDYQGKIDLLLCGPPWDSISESEYNQISNERKSISRAFYDLNDELITDVFTRGKILVSPHGKILITASMKTLPRFEKIGIKNRLSFNILNSTDLHNDGNIHYILEILFN